MEKEHNVLFSHNIVYPKQRRRLRVITADERFVRMRKMQGAWIQGERSVLLRTRLSLYIQSNDADCALSQTDYFASFNKYTITGKWSL